MRPPPAHRLRFRLAGVQPLSSGMQWKMKHLTNHTVELLHPSGNLTQGGRVERGTFRSLWPAGWPSATGSIFICPSHMRIFFCCVYNDMKNPGTTPCHRWKILVCSDYSCFSSHQLALNSKWNIFVSAEVGVSLFMELPGEGNRGRILVMTGSVIYSAVAQSCRKWTAHHSALKAFSAAFFPLLCYFHIYNLMFWHLR